MPEPTIDDLRRSLAHDSEIRQRIGDLTDTANALACGLDDWRCNAELHSQILDTWHSTNDEAERATAAEADAARQFLGELRHLVDAAVYAFSSYATEPGRAAVRTHLRAALNIWLGVDELADALESYRYEQVTP